MKRLLLFISILLGGNVYGQSEIYGYYQDDQFKMSQKRAKDYLFVRTDPSGGVVWIKSLDDLNSTDENTMNGTIDLFIVAGRTKMINNKITSNPYDYEYWFVDKKDSITNVIVFPNPTNNEINILTDLNLQETELQMMMFDSKFSIVENTNITQNRHVVNMSQIQSGIYFIILKTNKQNKLIKITKL